MTIGFSVTAMTTLLRVVAFLCLGWWSAQTSVAAETTTNLPPAAVTALSNQVARLEADWNAAHLANDASTVEKLCADDLSVIVPGMPPINKVGAVGSLQPGRLKFLQFTTSEVTIRFPTAETAIVTGRLQRVREMAGQMMTDDLRFTKVWVRRGAQWRVTAFHASPFSP